MAIADFTIRQEVRPCTINGIKALWHRWVNVSQIVPPSNLRGGHNGGVIANTLALVEYETGLVRMVEAQKVHFLDSRCKFDQYIFDEPPKEES